eukprot:CAMPEP_0195512182 /NCGR_PEP_ID=MMETSP0794_2-20130614/4225_1 /TAXON_ID=515487 /ORGANISM="Stephanopyxis turris, Strain CCMP 815" /LENGTH=239 /DNA_ID=CAMNT_0040639909 /DNA_START=87 /DNA_END=806 /DNA_ORIENTATION=+
MARCMKAAFLIAGLAHFALQGSSFSPAVRLAVVPMKTSMNVGCVASSKGHPRSFSVGGRPSSGISHLRMNADVAFNMANESFKLQSIGGYSVVATLIMNLSLRLFGSTKSQSKDSKVENIVGLIFTVFCVFSIITGAFTSIIFTLLTLYSKTALGFGPVGEDKYLAFFEATTRFREQGFYGFLASSFSFLISFVLSIFLRIKGKPRFIITLLTGSGVGYASFRINQIMSIATSTIFDSP